MLRALDGRQRGGFSSINPGFRGPKTRDIPGDSSGREDLTHSMYAHALAAPAMYTTAKWSGSEKGGGQETEQDRGRGGAICGCKVAAVGAMVDSPQPCPANCATYE